MTITIPESLVAEAEAKAKAAGFPSIEQYVADLIADDIDQEWLANHTPPDELVIKSRADLEAKLEEGYASGPSVIATPAFWEERKRVLAERMATRARAAAEADHPIVRNGSRG